MKESEHHSCLKGQHKSLKKELRRCWKQAMLEDYTSLKNLLVLRRSLKEQEERHRSLKNQLMLHMSSKKRPVHHMMSQKRLMEHHRSLKERLGHHMSLKTGNRVRMLELVVLHRNLKEKETVLHMSCLQRMVLHRNWSGQEGLHKSLKALFGQDCFHRSLLPAASCRSRSAGLGRNRNRELQTGL